MSAISVKMVVVEVTVAVVLAVVVVVMVVVVEVVVISNEESKIHNYWKKRNKLKTKVAFSWEPRLYRSVSVGPLVCHSIHSSVPPSVRDLIFGGQKQRWQTTSAVYPALFKSRLFK